MVVLTSVITPKDILLFTYDFERVGMLSWLPPDPSVTAICTPQGREPMVRFCKGCTAYVHLGTEEIKHGMGEGKRNSVSQRPYSEMESNIPPITTRGHSVLDPPKVGANLEKV